MLDTHIEYDSDVFIGKNIEKMEEIGKTMPVEEEIYDVAELFKVLGDQTRVKILFTLIKDEMCVCDIAELLEMSQSAISHQLRVLKQARLVLVYSIWVISIHHMNNCSYVYYIIYSCFVKGGLKIF